MRGKLKLFSFCLLVASSVTVSAQDAQWRQGGRFLYLTGGTTSQEVGASGAGLELGSGLGLEYVAVARFSEMFAAEFAVGATAQDLTAVGDDICCGGVDGGRVWLFPLTALGQLHIPVYGKADPYLGVGVAWTIPYYKLSNDLESEGVADIDFKGTIGLAAQAGLNYTVNNRWYANFDVRYLGVSLEAEVTDGNGDVEKVDLDIKPWVFGIGIGYRF